MSLLDNHIPDITPNTTANESKYSIGISTYLRNNTVPAFGAEIIVDIQGILYDSEYEEYTLDSSGLEFKSITIDDSLRQNIINVSSEHTGSIGFSILKIHIFLKDNLDVSKVILPFIINLYFNSPDGYQSTVSTDQLVVSQLGTYEKPFILSTKTYGLNWNETVANISYVNNTTSPLSITRVDGPWEYNDESINKTTDTIQIVNKVNRTNKKYEQRYKVSVGGYSEEILITQYANPNAIVYRFFEGDFVVKPYVENPSQNTYHIKLMTNNQEAVNVKMNSYDNPHEIINYASIRINELTKSDDYITYDFIVNQADINNVSGEKYIANYNIVLTDKNDNQLIIEKVTFTQESYCSVYFEPDTYEIDYRPKSFITFNVLGDFHASSTITSISKPDWITCEYNRYNGILTINNITTNDSSEVRTGDIIITLKNKTTVVPTSELVLHVVQNGKPKYFTKSAWEKIYVDMPEGYDTFHVYIKGKQVYQGTYIGNKIEISDIIRSYITTPMFIPDKVMSFVESTDVTIHVSNQGEGMIFYDEFHVIWDYSYKLTTSEDSIIITGKTQIVDYIDPRQYMILSNRDIFDVEQDPYIEEYSQFGLLVKRYNLYGVSFLVEGDNLYYITAIPNASTSKVIFGDITSGDSFTYNVKCTNANYCLYYLSPYGAWNWMLFEGKSIESDNIKRETYMSNVDNANIMDFETNNYLETINTSWSLSTGYLKDNQSAKFRYLVQSPKAYLHNLETNEIYAVNIDTNSVDVKKFKSNGRKFSTYTIKTTFAQNKTIIS